MKNEWRVFWDPGDSDYENNLKIARDLAVKLEVSEFLGKLLVSRGITDYLEAKEFLDPDEKMVFDPFLMKDMDKGTDILIDIFKKEEQVLIFGDYDVDGVTSSAILYLGLKDLGFKVDAYIPSRMDEGYSLNMDAISEFQKKGYKNIVTVDCGTSSIQEIDYAKSLGMKIVVTDHHETQENLPNADAIINPKRKDSEYPFRGLAGVGVAFKFLMALSSKFKNVNFDPYKYIDLVAIGTIADIVPLLSENRYFVKKGLEKLKTSPLKGVEALLRELKITPCEIKSHVIAYKVAPKINAAGRMADAETAFKLLISQDSQEISKNVSALIKLNTKRQSKEKEIYLYALSMIDINPEFENDKVLVLSGENWHLGVLGIVASKLSAQFNKPVLMISKEPPFGKGSARSPQGLNLIEIFKNAPQENLFNEFGGHELAAGFSLNVDNIESLRNEVNQSYNTLYGEKIPISEVFVDMEIDKIWAGFFDDIEKLEPFGYKNHEPVFLMNKVKVENMKFFGNAIESFAGKIRNKKDFILDIIGYGLASNLKDLRFNNPQSVNLNIVGNFRQENSYNMKYKFLRFYLKDAELLETEHLNEDLNHFDSNPLLKEEISKISKIEVINSNLNNDKISMFLPVKIKIATMLKKITNILSENKKIVIVSSSHMTLEHTYNSLCNYLPSSKMYYNFKSRINNRILTNEQILFVTVPAFFHNLKNFSSDKFFIIVDEPYYSMLHPAITNVPEYSEFRKYIVYKKTNIIILGTIFHCTLKEYLKRAGFKILVSNVSVSNYEVIKEDKKLFSLLEEYLKEPSSKIIAINDKKKQEILSKMFFEKFNLMKDNIKTYHNAFELSKKLIARESLKKSSIPILITSYSNNGIGMEMNGSKPLFILLDIPKTRLELLDLVSSWASTKNKIKFVLAYDEKFKTRLSYEFSRIYPSQNILKQTYDYIKNNPNLKEHEIVLTLFKGDSEFAKIVLDELIDSGMIVNNSNIFEILEPFDLNLIHKSVKFKESIIDKWILKESIDFFKNLDTKNFMELFKTDLSESKTKGV